MKILNRQIIVLNLKQPFVDWVNKHSPDGEHLELSDLNDDNTAYMIPNDIDGEEIDDFIDKNFREIFQAELYDWHTDEDLWPKIDLKTFHNWIEVQVHSMVRELGTGRLKLEEE